MTPQLRRAGLRSAAAGVALLLLGSTGAAHAASAATAEVAVRANTFEPRTVRIDPGGTVTWAVDEDQHTIVADDGRFAFTGPDGDTLPVGSRPSFGFGAAEEVVGYHCTIHGGPGGQGMSGQVVVGDPRLPVHPVPLVRVPEDAATPEIALEVVPAGGRVELAPGRYTLTTTLVVDRPDVAIAGRSGASADVVLEGVPGPQGLPDTGIVLAAPGARVEALTVTGFRSAGIVLRGPAGSVEDVVADGAGLTRDGVRVEAANGAGLRDVQARRHRRAGIAVEPCAACGVLLEGGHMADNLVGVLLTGATGVVLRGATVTANAAGVVARGDTAARSGGLQLLGNTIAGNVSRSRLPAVTAEDRRLAVGAGVWLSGTTDALVRGNTVTGHTATYGIALAGGPAVRVTVAGNTTTGNAVDLGWDGLGASVCFAADPGATSEPPAATTLYPCERPTPGVPFPVVGARLAAEALRS